IAITDIREGRFTTDAANASSFDGAVTIDRRASDGEAIVRTWSHANGVQYVSGELAGYTLSANSSLSISRVHGSGREFVVATGRDTAGNLRIQTWAVSVTGELGLMAEEILNGVSDVSVVGATTRDFVTAVIGGGKARLISWSHSNGRKLRRKGTVVATGGGAISELDIGARMVAGNLFAAVRDSDGELALLQHRVNFDPAF
ncbi:MAG: hypothetical protein KTR35_02820, partial [Gammaproteobacteria bacterium]|nr:hypothetical protein [Gammaproteobacteria bacterium]